VSAASSAPRVRLNGIRPWRRVAGDIGANATRPYPEPGLQEISRNIPSPLLLPYLHSPLARLTERTGAAIAVPRELVVRLR
jgi:hypothetical protein